MVDATGKTKLLILGVGKYLLIAGTGCRYQLCFCIYLAESVTYQ